jgi:hypothetical protein
MEFGDTIQVRTHLRKPELDAQEAARAGMLGGR